MKQKSVLNGVNDAMSKMFSHDNLHFRTEYLNNINHLYSTILRLKW